MMPTYDFHMVLAALGVALLGGVIGLDRTAAGQFMVSQPIVAGPLTGWMLGEPTTGLVIGAALELVWVLDLPVGTFVPANATVGTVSATAIAVLGNPAGASLPVIGFSMLLTTATVPLTMKADGLIRTWNARLAETALSASETIAGHALGRAQVAGLVLFFLKSFVLYCIFIPLGVAAVALFGHLPDAFHRAMSLFVKLLPMLGVALVVRKLSIRTFDRYFLAGLVIAAILAQLYHGPALVIPLMTAAAGWLGARYNERQS